MAEETPTATPIASSAVEAAPVVAVATPSVEATPASTPEVAPVTETSAPVPETTPAPEAQKVEAATVEVAKPLLDPESPKEQPKVETVVEEAKAEPAPAPVCEFKLPEGTNADNPAFKSFQSKLGEFQTLAKADQGVAQKFGQEMIDMHLADVRSVIENQNKSAWDWFNNRNKEWLETAKKDPQIGGDNFNQTVSDATRAISLYGGTKAQQIETAKLLQETGVENNPIMLRFLSNITRIAAKEGSPVLSQNTPVQKLSIAEAMFGGKKSA